MGLGRGERFLRLRLAGPQARRKLGEDRETACPALLGGQRADPLDPAASACRGRPPGIQPSQYMTARRMVPAALPQEKIGSGCCTGLGNISTSVNCTCLPA